MSKKGKYENSNQKPKKSGKFGWILLILLVVLIALGVYLMTKDHTEIPEETHQPEVTEGAEVTVPETGAVQIDQVETVSMELGNGLVITDIGRYAGIYMEDGSDDIVSDVLMIVVTNTGDMPVQYAEISLSAGAETAGFSLSTLPAGESVVLLEQNRLEYSETVEYSDAVAQNVAMFSEPLSLCEDKFSIQLLDGGFNIINISGQDIADDITIYYKNCSSDMLYGGITYRVRITEDMESEEIKQVMSDHFSASGSKIMFVTCG